MTYRSYDPITHQYKVIHLITQGHHEIYNDPYYQHYSEYLQYEDPNAFNYADYNQIPNSGAYPQNYHYPHGSNTSPPTYNKKDKQNPYINEQKYADVKRINKEAIPQNYPTQIRKNNNKPPYYNIPGYGTDIHHKNKIPPNNTDYYQNVNNVQISNANNGQNRNLDNNMDYDKFLVEKTSDENNNQYKNEYQFGANYLNNQDQNIINDLSGTSQKKAMTTLEENQGFSSKPEDNKNKSKTEINNTPNTNNSNNNIRNFSKESSVQIPFELPNEYLFHKTGLYNIGSTCYMNATLQCLLHVSPLISYFAYVYPKDKNKLAKLNESIKSKGNISEAFYGIIKAIEESGKNSKKNTQIGPYQNYMKSNNAVSPENFQKTVGTYNPQFQNLEANDSKDLILYLLQVMHQELNYFTKNNAFTGYPNQYSRPETFMAFISSYDATNCSIISNLFYGTSENTTKCESCTNIIYNFQKFEFLSFGVFKYHKKEFNLYNGFDDYVKIDKLTGDNKYYCNFCKKLCDAEIYTKILFPPKHLLINIDYGKNKKYMPKSIKYDDEIDITKYLNWDYGKPVKYKILGICSHYGDSGSYGHYIAFCRNKQNSKWYQFNDAMVSECGKEEIKNGGTPYLLLYERID